jgi:hypothetical protein
MRERYDGATAERRTVLLDEMETMTGFHRKALIRRMNRPMNEGVRGRRRKRGRPPRYGPAVVAALVVIWKAAGYPWSARLKALLPAWLAHARRHMAISAETETRLRQMSARQMDRCLAPHKRELRRRMYGRTKPGTLLKHHIPLKTDRWDVNEPGFSEVDLVSHSGDCAEGEFAHSVNLTDIDSTWVETRAVLGKSQVRVQDALARMRENLPFALRGIDSDNGSEFINAHLYRYCKAEGIQFTRGRPYKKDDNAHIEQKNWTHVRKLVGYERYDTVAAVEALNDLYEEVRLLQNLFLPSVKLIAKRRVGSRLRRTYDAPQTPLDRVVARGKGDATKVAGLIRQRAHLDPFALAARIDRKLERVFRVANRRTRPASTTRESAGAPREPASQRPVEAAGPVDAGERAHTNTEEQEPGTGNPNIGATITPRVTLIYGLTGSLDSPRSCSDARGAWLPLPSQPVPQEGEPGPLPRREEPGDREARRVRADDGRTTRENTERGPHQAG